MLISVSAPGALSNLDHSARISIISELPVPLFVWQYTAVGL